MSHYSRNGRYELFTHNRRTYCFDESHNPVVVNAPDEMWQWLREQPGCEPMDDTNVAYYLDPQTYLIWKLKWT